MKILSHRTCLCLHDSSQSRRSMISFNFTNLLKLLSFLSLTFPLLCLFVLLSLLKTTSSLSHGISIQHSVQLRPNFSLRYSRTLLPVLNTINTTKQKEKKNHQGSFQGKYHHSQQIKLLIQICPLTLLQLYIRGNNMNLHMEYYIICLLKTF